MIVQLEYFVTALLEYIDLHSSLFVSAILPIADNINMAISVPN